MLENWNSALLDLVRKKHNGKVAPEDIKAAGVVLHEPFDAGVKMATDKPNEIEVFHVCGFWAQPLHAGARQFLELSGHRAKMIKIPAVS